MAMVRLKGLGAFKNVTLLELQPVTFQLVA
jgi:hypothetical protein